MFRRIVSNLSFSPALVGQLGFYAKRLRGEETTRRIGLIFTALALVVQYFAVFSPPESANASSANSFVSGGVKSVSEFVKYYDSNHNNIKDLFNSLGITKNELEAAKKQTVNSKGVYSWGLQSRFSKSQGEGSYSVNKDGDKGTRNFHYRPLSLWDTGGNVKNGSNYTMFVGKSSKLGWFAIIDICGNLVTKTPPAKPECPKGTVGVYPKCTQPPSARCDYLKISNINNSHTFKSRAVASNEASIKSYRYTVKKNGSVIHTKTITSAAETNEYTYSQSEVGNYTVELVVITSLGEKSGNDCVKTFNVTAPEVCAVNPSLSKDDPLCQPCPGDESLWIKDAKCKSELVQTKTAKNGSQGNVDASTVISKENDRITYLLTIENTGLLATTTDIHELLDDVSEYSSVIDDGGGTLDQEAKTLSWKGIKLEPKEKQTRAFTVQVSEKISAMPQGHDDKDSYNCIMTNTFGNTVQIPVKCPTPKVVEAIVSEMPKTGPTENLIFAGILISIVAYFYARSRQLKTEVRLIRRDLNTGTV